MSHHPQKPKSDKPDENAKFVPSYQTNKVPWQIHAMFITFTIAAIIYLVRLAIPDFIHWW